MCIFALKFKTTNVMGIFDKILGNKNIKEQIENLAGNANIVSVISQLTSNNDFMTKLAAAKDENDMQRLISTALDAFKDLKLTEDEKANLVSQLKKVASGFTGKK